MFKNKVRALYTLSITLALLMFATVCGGCSATISDPVVAKVGDVEITYSDYYQQFQAYVSYGMIDTSTAESLAEGHKLIFDMLVKSALPVAEAHREGYTLTEEEETTARQDGIEAASNYYLADYLDDTIEDENARQEAAIAKFNATYKSQGYEYSDIQAGFEEDYIQDALRDKFVAALYVDIPETTDDEAKAWYDEHLASEREEFAADPAAYYDAVQSYSYSGDVRPLVAPEGLFYVKHILIKSENDAGEAQDAAALADEAMQKYLDGGDFNTLIDEYNQDTSMLSTDNGYIMGEGLGDMYNEEYYNAAVALGVDDITTLTFSDSSVYIIKRMADISTDPVPYEDAATDIKSKILTDKKSDAYTAAQEEWEANISVKLYEKRVQYVGLSK